MDTTLAWLMQGDPAIRWQTLRDLLDPPAEQWQAEEALTTQEGWGSQLLAAAGCRWPLGGGIYTPKWTSTTYTLLDAAQHWHSTPNGGGTAGSSLGG